MKRAVILAFVFFLTIFIVGLVNAFEARNVNTGEVINIQEGNEIQENLRLGIQSSENPYFRDYLNKREFELSVALDNSGYNSYDITSESFELSGVDLGMIWSVITNSSFYPNEDEPFFFNSESNFLTYSDTN